MIDAHLAKVRSLVERLPPEADLDADYIASLARANECLRIAASPTPEMHELDRLLILAVASYTAVQCCGDLDDFSLGLELSTFSILLLDDLLEAGDKHALEKGCGMVLHVELNGHPASGKSLFYLCCQAKLARISMLRGLDSDEAITEWYDLYVGIEEAMEVSGNEDFYRPLLAWLERNRWVAEGGC